MLKEELRFTVYVPRLFFSGGLQAKARQRNFFVARLIVRGSQHPWSEWSMWDRCFVHLLSSSLRPWLLDRWTVRGVYYTRSASQSKQIDCTNINTIFRMFSYWHNILFYLAFANAVFALLFKNKKSKGMNWSHASLFLKLSSRSVNRNQEHSASYRTVSKTDYAVYSPLIVSGKFCFKLLYLRGFLLGRKIYPKEIFEWVSRKTTL